MKVSKVIVKDSGAFFPYPPANVHCTEILGLHTATKKMTFVVELAKIVIPSKKKNETAISQ